MNHSTSFIYACSSYCITIAFLCTNTIYIKSTPKPIYDNTYNYGILKDHIIILNKFCINGHVELCRGLIHI